MKRTHAAVLLVLAASAAPVAAQTPISPGQTVRGTLEMGDQTGPEAYYDAYMIRGRPGDRVLVQMRSAEFDTHLRWGSEAEGQWMDEAANDDAGEGTDSRLVVILGEPGTLELRASGFAWSDMGDYELVVTEAPPRELPPIRPGEAVRGELDDSDPPGETGVEDHFIVRAEPGSTFTAHLESGDFHPHLLIGTLQEGQFESVMGGDWGGQRGVSRLVWEIGEPAEYRLVVRAFAGEGRGAYTLRMEAGGDDAQHEPSTVPTATEDETVRWVDGAPVLPSGYEGLVVAHYGSTLDGALDGDSPRDAQGGRYHEYAVVGHRDHSMTVDVSTADFDPVVSIGRGRGADFQMLAEDDDGGPGHNARAKHRVRADGIYVIRVRAAAPGQTGEYELLLSSQP
jgi:hypothetical protein